MDLQQTEVKIRPGSANRIEALRARLNATRDHITEHFRFEEQNGYMDLVRHREPCLEHAIHRLAAEHRELAGSLEALIDEIRSATELNDGFRVRIRHWLRRVRQHETDENDLVQGTLVTDLAAED
jgi:hypothetical protein